MPSCMLRPELALSPPDSRTFVVGFWSPKIGLILAQDRLQPLRGRSFGKVPYYRG